MLKFHVTPSTADDKTRQFVYVDFLLSLPEGVMVPSSSRFSS